MLHELRHFLAVVEHGTFTAAAKRVGLSQPALSASIRRLEDDVGARLLHRGPAGARLTAAGEALLAPARRALAAVEDGRRAVAEVEGLQAGEVMLGGGPTACTYLLPPALAAFRAAHPGLRFRLTEAHTPAVLGALRAGRIDLGVVSDGYPVGPGLEVEDWRADELIVVGPPGGVGEAWVCFPRPSALRTALERAWPAADVVMELGSIAAVKGNVRAGVGRALVSRAAVERDLREGRLVELGEPPIHRRFVLAHRGVEQLPPAAAALRALLLSGGTWS
jgi:DNA-binding transcriptional LysR family regulator